MYYAQGLSPDRVKEQHTLVDELNEKFDGFKIFKGTECDILADGGLDYPDEVLASFNFVVISVHSKLNMTEKEATERILKALRNPYVTILGHPTGRLLLGREGYPLDIHKIIDAALESDFAIELNASPFRFDLDWRYGKYAKEKGVLISINPDSHSVDGLHDINSGVGIARKGWLEKQNILNALSLEEIERYFKMKSER